jgi:NADPH:quinone reductase-like Zn-dependent oxidoreductase
VIAGVALGPPGDLREVVELADAGALAPVVDRSYPLEEIVEAHRYVDAGHKRGGVVVTVG